VHFKQSANSMKNPRILIVVTSVAKMPNGESTGLWLEEFAVPYEIFKGAGAAVTVTSPRGGAAPIDPRSELTGADAGRWQEASEKLKNTAPLTAIKAKDFDAIFLPGGHGTMFDFPDNAALMGLLRDFDATHKPIAAVYHAPAALVTAADSAGILLIQGKAITGFTDSEERAVKLDDQVPFLLETRLRELGADFRDGPDFQPHTERAGRLITGQNPASSDPAAHLGCKPQTAENSVKLVLGFYRLVQSSLVDGQVLNDKKVQSAGPFSKHLAGRLAEYPLFTIPSSSRHPIDLNAMVANADAGVNKGLPAIVDPPRNVVENCLTEFSAVWAYNPYLHLADIRRLLDYLKARQQGYGSALAFHLANALFQTACRFEELIQVSWGDCQRVGEDIVALRIKGKGSVFQDVPVTGALNQALKEWKTIHEGFKGRRILAPGGIAFTGSQFVFAGYSGGSSTVR
jgi:putative intracellular protease/amidase